MTHTEPHDWRWRLEQEDLNCENAYRPYEVLAIKALASEVQLPTHMVVCNKMSGSVFVKEYNFFVSQGGLVESWGNRWKPVWATDIEDAREQGCKLFECARPYARQAK